MEGPRDDVPVAAEPDVAWQRFCRSTHAIALDHQLALAQRALDEISGPSAAAAPPERSPVFGLMAGETRRIVIDGVAFDVTREVERPDPSAN